MKLELIDHFTALSIALLMFFMKFTAPNWIGELILKAIGKAIPLFVMLYAGVKIFKYFGII